MHDAVLPGRDAADSAYSAERVKVKISPFQGPNRLIVPAALPALRQLPLKWSRRRQVEIVKGMRMQDFNVESDRQTICNVVT